MARGDWKTKLLLRIALFILAGLLYLLSQWLQALRVSRPVPTSSSMESPDFIIHSL